MNEIDSTFMDVLRKSMPDVIKADRETTQIMERMSIEVKTLMKVLDIYSQTNDIEHIDLHDKLEDLIYIYYKNISKLTDMVRKVRNAKGERRFKILEDNLSGRFYDAFATRPNKSENIEPEIRKYNGKNADELYLDFIREVPRLSASGGKMTRKKYRAVYEYVERMKSIFSGNRSQYIDKIQNEVEQLREGLTSIEELAGSSRIQISGDVPIVDMSEAIKDFNKIERNMLDVFTEVAIDLSDFKDLEKETGLKGDEEILQMGLSGGLSRSIYQASEFVNEAFQYVKEYIAKLRLDEKSYTKELATAMDTFDMFEKLTDDIDGHTFNLPDGKTITITLN